MSEDILWDKSGRLNRALALLEEINAAGYALVPLTPTQAMTKAGMIASDLAAETVNRIFIAMLSAAGDGMPKQD